MIYEASTMPDNNEIEDQLPEWVRILRRLESGDETEARRQLDKRRG